MWYTIKKLHCGRCSCLESESPFSDSYTSIRHPIYRIDTARMKKPSFMMVLTANSDIAYKRKDGVYVVPIGCLGV